MFLEKVVFMVSFHCFGGLEGKGNYQLKTNLKGNFQALLSQQCKFCGTMQYLSLTDKDVMSCLTFGKNKVAKDLYLCSCQVFGRDFGYFWANGI